MLRRLSLTVAALLGLAVCNPYYVLAQQDTSTAANPAASSAAPGDDVAALKAENAALKKEVSDAAQTIAQLQAKLAAAGVPPTASTDTTAPAPANAGPQKALPLDATNAATSAAAPDAPAPYTGPSKNYTVVGGDTLSKIAKKMYPGHAQSGLQKIEEANQATLPDPARLKIGQVLIIPQ